MRSLLLTNYPITIKRPDPKNPGAIVNTTADYDVRESLVAILFADGCTGREVLKRDAIATKIETEPTDTVLLEDAEFAVIEKAFAAWTRFSRNESELIKRIDNAPTVNLRDLAAMPDVAALDVSEHRRLDAAGYPPKS